jgi:hypothetical protein
MEPDPLPEFRQWLAGALDEARDGLGMSGSVGMRANA